MLEARGGDWGVVGVNLRAPRLAESLGAQDGLYARRLRDDSGADECRIIGCIRGIVDAQEDCAPAVAALADPAHPGRHADDHREGLLPYPGDGRAR